VKLDLALRELHRAEKAMAADLLAMSDRHRAEHEVHHVARDLAEWSRRHSQELAAAARDHGFDLDDESAIGAEPRAGDTELSGDDADPGVLLLADLRSLHRAAAGVSLDWELLAQGAQATRTTALLELAQRCHPETLRQLKWTNAMLKTLSPQVLAS
jgi:hypothetical protein